MRWAGHVARIGEVRNAYKFWSKTRTNRQLGRSGSRWEDNIRKNLGKQGGKVWTSCNLA